MLSMSVDGVMTKVCNLATFNAPFQIENTAPENVHAGAGCLLELWDEFAKGLVDVDAEQDRAEQCRVVDVDALCERGQRGPKQ
jgi:hypothetical protein